MTRCLLPLTILVLSGCGEPFYAVRGSVTFDDGAPLTQGTVVAESITREGPEAITARGEIRPDGSFDLATEAPGDGVPAGKYRVLVAPIVDVNAPTPQATIPIDPRFTEFNTSGLELEVQPGKNELPIRVSKPGKAVR